MKILHNHLGYACQTEKQALIRHSKHQALENLQFSVFSEDSREIVYQGTLKPLGGIADWRDWNFWQADFLQSGNWTLPYQPRWHTAAALLTCFLN